jgi:glutamine synthetase
VACLGPCVMPRPALCCAHLLKHNVTYSCPHPPACVSACAPQGNERRLTGKHETSSMHDFSWGVANRGCSIRVGRMVPVDKCGYYEDRRPASNLDPYVVCKLLVETTLLM